MEAALFVWFAGISHSLVTMLALIGGVTFCVLGFVSFILYLEGKKQDFSKTTKYVIVPLAFLSLLVASIIPSEKTLYMMAGAYFGQKAVQSEMADDVYKMIQKKLKTYVESPEEAIKDGKKISDEVKK